MKRNFWVQAMMNDTEELEITEGILLDKKSCIKETENCDDFQKEEIKTEKRRKTKAAE